MEASLLPLAAAAGDTWPCHPSSASASTHTPQAAGGLLLDEGLTQAALQGGHAQENVGLSESSLVCPAALPLL